MTTIVTRSGKGSPLTNTEVDANFTNLNTDKLDLTGGTLTGPLIVNEPTAVTMSAGTTAQRPTGVAGMFRYNTTDGQFEGYTTSWGSVGGVADNSVTTAKIVDGAVTTAKLANTSVTTAKIANDAVGADQLAASAVVTASIVDDAVTAAKLASNAVVTASIVDDNVTQAKIADDAVGADQLAASAVVTASIVDDAVTAAKISSEPITVGITSVVTASSLTATVNTHVYVSSATKTITLPASPTIGQRVLITVGNFTDTVIGRNGSNIMSSASDLTMNAAYLSIQFIFTDATQGWVMS